MGQKHFCFLFCAVFALVFSCESRCNAQNACVCLVDYMWDDADNLNNAVYLASIITFSEDCDDGDFSYTLISAPFELVLTVPQGCSGCGSDCQTNGIGCVKLDESGLASNAISATHSVKISMAASKQLKRRAGEYKSYIANDFIVMVDDRFFRLLEFRSNKDDKMVTARAGYEIGNFSGPFRDLETTRVRKTVSHIPETGIEVLSIHVGADTYTVCTLQEDETSPITKKLR